MTARPLHDHQVSALALLRHSLARGCLSPMLQAPTGAGKTRIAAEIVRSARAKDKCVLFIVPALELVEQTLKALEAEGIRHIGVMQGLHERTDSRAPVQIASVQTLQRRKMPACDVIIVDEAHRRFAFFEPMIAAAKADGVPVIGLSATPWTKSLGKHYDDLLTVVSTSALIEAGLLSGFRVFAPSHPDLASVGTIAGDYHEGELAAAMNTPDLVADVVSTWLQRGEGRPTLCFGVDRAHAKHLQKEFAAAGVPTGYIDAHTTRGDRAEIRRQFHNGEIKVVCNVACLTTGIDWDVRCIVLARPTKSEMLFVQIIGRGLRTAPGKVDCLILDHSDTHLNLGLVTDIGHDHLDDGIKTVAKTRERKPPPRECPKCSFLRPEQVRECPNCGFAPTRQNEVKVEDGELVAFDRAAAQALTERKRSVYGQLLWLASHHRYSPGWASHKFKEFFGVWPNAVRDARPIKPEPAMRAWVKSRAIAYAKSRRSA